MVENPSSRPSRRYKLPQEYFEVLKRWRNEGGPDFDRAQEERRKETRKQPETSGPASESPKRKRTPISPAEELEKVRAKLCSLAKDPKKAVVFIEKGVDIAAFNPDFPPLFYLQSFWLAVMTEREREERGRRDRQRRKDVKEAIDREVEGEKRRFKAQGKEWTDINEALARGEAASRLLAMGKPRHLFASFGRGRGKTTVFRNNVLVDSVDLLRGAGLSLDEALDMTYEGLNIFFGSLLERGPSRLASSSRSPRGESLDARQERIDRDSLRRIYKLHRRKREASWTTFHYEGEASAPGRTHPEKGGRSHLTMDFKAKIEWPPPRYIGALRGRDLRASRKLDPWRKKWGLPVRVQNARE